MKKQEDNYEKDLGELLDKLSKTVDDYVQTEKIHITSAIAVVDIVKQRLMNNLLHALFKPKTSNIVKGLS